MRNICEWGKADEEEIKEFHPNSTISSLSLVLLLWYSLLIWFRHYLFIGCPFHSVFHPNFTLMPPIARKHESRWTNKVHPLSKYTSQRTQILRVRKGSEVPLEIPRPGIKITFPWTHGKNWNPLFPNWNEHFHLLVYSLKIVW